MSDYVVNEREAKELRDDRYGTVYETASPSSTKLKQLGFAIVTVDVGRRSPDRYHRKTEELYYITEARGVIRIGREAHDVAPGDTVCIPIGTVHSIENIGTTLLRFTCATSPPYDGEDDFEIETDGEEA
jgi:mannose-6-phosphate isomerase-like protein (cupin superfamily)